VIEMREHHCNEPPRIVLGRQLYGKLRDALMLGELRPGDRLTFRDVAARMSTSVTPV